MTEFDRRGHERTNAHGTTFWVSGHRVRRDDWRHAVSSSELLRADAVSYLQRHLARTISGCYVTPNAKCPVCREPVFFYANRFGSRVFFDELGPSWAKHPCTDKPRNGGDTLEARRQPLVRKLGERLELLEKATIAGHTEKDLYGEGPHRYHLLVVDSVLRDGRNNLVVCNCLTANPSTPIKFNCLSDAEVFDVGDFLSKQGSWLSFFDREAMNIVKFRSGDDFSTLSVGGEIEAGGTRVISPDGSATRSELVKRYYQLDALSESDRLHFQNSRMSVEDLCNQVRPFIKKLSLRRIRRPEAVTPYLNNHGYRTAVGALWSIRLVYVLLSLLFDKKSKNLRKGIKRKGHAARQNQRRR